MRQAIAAIFIIFFIPLSIPYRRWKSKVLSLSLAFLAVFTATPAGQEVITLKASIPAINSFEPEALMITLLPIVSVRVSIRHAASGRTESFIYPCNVPCAMSQEDDVRKMVAALNTANLSTRSLWRRIFDRLVVDFPERFPGGATVQ